MSTTPDDARRAAARAAARLELIRWQVRRVRRELEGVRTAIENGEQEHMSKSVNRVTLVGNIGAEPEVRTTPSGTKLAKVSLATSRTWEGHDGRTHEKTEWHRLTLWAALADIAERYIHKGDRLYVEGRIEYSTTQGDDGTTRHWTDIVAGELVMLGSPGRANAPERAGDRPAGAGTAPSGPDAAPFDADGDPPF